MTGVLNWYRALRHRRSLDDPRVPALILWGGRDAFLEPGLADAALDLCDRGRLVRFPRATHWLQHEAAEAVNAELIAFLKG